MEYIEHDRRRKRKERKKREKGKRAKESIVSDDGWCKRKREAYGELKQSVRNSEQKASVWPYTCTYHDCSNLLHASLSRFACLSLLFSSFLLIPSILVCLICWPPSYYPPPHPFFPPSSFLPLSLKSHACMFRQIIISSTI